MQSFKYKALTPDTNKVIEQTIQARDKSEVISLLKSKKLKIISVKKIKTQDMVLFAGGVSTVDKANFCRYMAIMLKSGLSISEAVELILSETESYKMKEILQDLAFSLQEGGEISVVLRKYPEIFDTVFLALVRAGEQSGSLEKTFEYLADEIYSSYRLTKKIQGSMMYPAVIVGAMAVLGIVMMTFILPKLSEVFLKMKIALPTATRILLSVGNFMGKNVGLVMGIFGLVVVTIIFLLKNSKTKAMISSAIANAPIAKRLYRQIDLSRFSRTLASLLQAGVPIVKSLNIASETLTQKDMIRVAKGFEKGVTEGKEIGNLFETEKKVFPAIMVQTIKTGEKTGTLDKVLVDVADYYEEELDGALKEFVAILEPAIMIVIGIAVGAMVIMVLAPIYSVVGGMEAAQGM